MRKLNYLIIVMMIATGLFMQSCEKDQAVEQQTAEISFAIDNTGLDLKSTTVPECIENAVIDHVVFILGGVEYNSPVIWVDGLPKTQAIKLYVEPNGDPKDYILTSFLVYDASNVLIMAAPAPGSVYHDLMVNRLDLTITVQAFKKQEVIIDVLCFEELLYEYFGFVWFEMNEVVIERMCFFMDLCLTDNVPQYIQDYYGGAMDVVSRTKIEVFRESNLTTPIRTFTNLDVNGDLIEGDCLEIYWPNDLDVDENFVFKIYYERGLNDWKWILTASGGDDPTELFGNIGTDGVIDIVIGTCGDGSADYTFGWNW